MKEEITYSIIDNRSVIELGTLTTKYRQLVEIILDAINKSGKSGWPDFYLAPKGESMIDPKIAQSQKTLDNRT